MDKIFRIMVRNSRSEKHTLVYFNNGTNSCSCGIMSPGTPNLRKEEQWNQLSMMELISPKFKRC